MRLLSTRTSVNDIAKHKKKGKRGYESNEKRQLRFLSTRTNAIEVLNHKIKGKRGY